MTTTTQTSSPQTDTEVHRPRHHLTPRSTWMNDPNGLIRHRGRWHAFFQNNPFGSTWGNMSWGHAVSDDLATWTDLGVALPCRETEKIFSGSVVHDEDNTSGLGADGGPGPLVAIFTSAYDPEDPERPGLQAQSLAFSEDDGLTWEYLAENPVLDRGSANFRDPKVFWHPESGRWVMVAVEATDRQLLIHTSADLQQWEHASTLEHPGIDGGIWECPDLVRLPGQGPAGEDAWVLILSTNPGGPAGGSGTWTVLGDFDGRTFTPSQSPRPMDLGQDFYAAVSFSGVEAEPVVLGWMNNWDYAEETPTHPWRSAMSLPRTLRLDPGPDGESELRSDLVIPEQLRRIDLAGAPAGGPSSRADRVLEVLDEPVVISGTLDPSVPSRIMIRFGPDDDAPQLSILVDDEGSVMMDRSRAHREPFAPEHAVSATWRPGHDQPVPFRLVLDRSTAELELDGGRAVISQQVFPGA